MHDEQLLDAFEHTTLAAAAWNHQAHVRVAYLYASRHGLAAATGRMRTSIQAFNRATNTPETLDRGYHETITQAFMRLVFAAQLQTGPHGSSAEFCEQHPDLLDKSLLTRFYSPDRIRSPRAKGAFVAPDLCPLPTVFSDTITIGNVQSAECLQNVRELLLEYGRSLNFSLCFQQFDAELQGLPGRYGLPGGRLLLARDRREPVGCVAIRPLADNLCEMKRLWVRPALRGRGLGRELAQFVINEARAIGYSGIRLDTTPAMQSAISLYRTLGFREISADTANPVSGVIFMHRDLAGVAGPDT